MADRWISRNQWRTRVKNNQQQLYTDSYFDKGHWGLKIWQTLVAILSWLTVIIPIVVTGMSFYFALTGRGFAFWRYREGISEVEFIGVLILFLAAVALIYTVTMAVIQVRKRERLVEQWPTYNPLNQRSRNQTVENFMTERFGDADFREHVRNYRVEPEQNLETDQIQQLYAQKKIKEV